MGTVAVGNHRAAGVQAPKAHLSSLTTWRCQDGPPTTETFDEILVRQVPCSTPSHAGQSRQENSRSRWSESTQSKTKDDTCQSTQAHPQSKTSQKGLDTQTWNTGKARFGDTGHV